MVAQNLILIVMAVAILLPWLEILRVVAIFILSFFLIIFLHGI
ncbi:hypothetical protein [Campylobacter devanensis]|nr:MULTISPECIES: hypothetical protein [unclassified Campylobacter]